MNSLLSGIGLHGYVCGDPNPARNTPPNKGNFIVNNKVSHTSGTPIAAGINFLDQGPDSIVCPAHSNTVTGNNSSYNQADGIFVDGNSKNNTINANTVNYNGLDGIFLGGPSFQNQFTNLGGTLFDLTSPDRAPYMENTDYRVMSGPGSGDVTAKMTAIDITLAPGADATNNPQPVDTSTSGCEQADYTAAGFAPGDIALIQRGTCTFVSKVALAVQNGASAVVMFNEGQAPNRTTANFGSVGPQSIPVLSAAYGVGFELHQLTKAGDVTAHIVTNTSNDLVKVADGAVDNTLKDNRGHDNAVLDGEDENKDCGTNKWAHNRFVTVNQKCVAAAAAPAGSAVPAARAPARTRLLAWRGTPRRQQAEPA
ncbi:MAG: right-handed parallel beta-helix repeat-containing protein [Actinomycetota bacterium]|nr:right-handed parallel beta-helix repeat-containing protein [Actinomycetota bacterium]